MMKLSIVITAFNVENHIKRSLDSLNRQTTKNFELIVVDDGSTDGTVHQINEILQGKKDTDYKIFTQKNEGVSSARNRGLMEAGGEFVMFLDGDDYVAANLVESIYDSFNKQSADVVCWGFNTVNEDRLVLANYFDTYEHIESPISGDKVLNYILVNRSMWICTGSAAFRKDFLFDYALRYTEGCANGEDQEFSIKVLSRATKVVFINQILSFYVQRHGSVTYSRNIKKFDAIDAMKRAIRYLNETDDQTLKNIAGIIETQYLVENYFNSLDSCMTNSGIKPLLTAISKNYPDLNREIREKMKRYHGRGEKFNKYLVKSKLYLISPELYAAFVFLKRRTIGCERWGSK